MRRILFQETDLNSLPNPPAGFKYVGFDGSDFSIKQGDGQINSVAETITYYLALNFIDLEEFIYISPENFKISTITNPSNLVVTITKNEIPYTLGSTINEFDIVKVSVNSIGFIKLNCEKV